MTSSMYDMKCPLAERVARWYECTVHPWVLFTVANGYRLQFAVKPPTFNAVLSSVANVCADPGRGDCDIIKQTRNQMGSGQGKCFTGFIPHTFLFQRRGPRLRPILDLRVLNRHFKEIHVQDADRQSTLLFESSK